MNEVPVSSLDERAQKQFANARAAVERGNFEYAVDICLRILQESPNCLEARRLLRSAQRKVHAHTGGGLKKAFWHVAGLGIAFSGHFIKRRNPAKAMMMAERVLCMDPYHLKGLSLVAYGSRAMGLYETEAFCLENICAKYPDNAVKLERYCKALIDVGQTDRALAVAERLASLKPGNTHIQELVKSASVAHSINRGKWAEEGKDFRSKLKEDEGQEQQDADSSSEDVGVSLKAKDLKEEIRKNPQKLDTYKLLARELISKEDYEGAIACLGKAFKLPQAEGDTYLHQLHSELQLKRAEQELFDLRAGNDDDGSNAARIEEVEADLKGLRLHQAKRLVEQFPNDYSQRFKYGEQLLQQGDVDKAIEQFQVAQRSPSLKLKAHVMLGKCFMEKKLHDLALEQLEIANAETATMDTFKKDVLYQIALCHESLDKAEVAMSHYKQIYASDIGFRDVAQKINSFYGSDS